MAAAITEEQWRTIYRLRALVQSVAEIAQHIKLARHHVNRAVHKGWASEDWGVVPIDKLLSLVRADATGGPIVMAAAQTRLSELREHARIVVNGGDDSVATIAMALASRDMALRGLLLAEKALEGLEELSQGLLGDIAKVSEAWSWEDDEDGAAEKRMLKRMQLMKGALGLARDAVTVANQVADQQKRLGLVPKVRAPTGEETAEGTTLDQALQAVFDLQKMANSRGINMLTPPSERSNGSS